MDSEKNLFLLFGELSSTLVKFLNYPNKYDETSNFQKQVVTTLIEKKGGKELFIKKWRLISLINVDVKIASKAMAFRITTVIPIKKDFDPNRTTYVKSRFVGESNRLIDDILYHADMAKFDSILFATDLEKAFDFVDHKCIFDTVILPLPTLYTNGGGVQSNPPAISKTVVPMNVKFCRVLQTSLNVLEVLNLFTYCLLVTPQRRCVSSGKSLDFS